MKQEFQEACDDPDNPVIDVNANGDTVLSMLVKKDGMNKPDMIDGTLENVLLYIHELHEFIYSEETTVLCNDPYISVTPTNKESTYQITIEDRSVENMPDIANEVLVGVKDAIEDDDLEKIIDVYEKIIDNQVRRDVINKLLHILPKFPEERINITDQGWMIDQYYLVDWTASVYTREDNDDENYRRGSGGVESYDKSFEFVELEPRNELERATVPIDGEEVVIGEQEMLFLWKVEWLLNRHEYHQDKPFWLWQEKRRQRFLEGDI